LDQTVSVEPLERLELLRSGDDSSEHAPILFLHGAFAGAWCWAEQFMPYFAERGLDCYAVSLRGHGGSAGRERLTWHSLGDYVDLLDLRIKVRKSLAEGAAKEAEAEYADQVIGKLVEQAKIQFPPMLTDQEIDDLMHDLIHQLEARDLSLEQYLKLEDKTEAKQRDEFRERADRRVRRALVLGKLVELEKLEVGEVLIEERIGQMARTVQDPEGSVRRALSTDSAKRRIRNELLFEQAVTFLVAVAKGEEPTPATVSSAGLAQP